MYSWYGSYSSNKKKGKTQNEHLSIVCKRGSLLGNEEQDFWGDSPIFELDRWNFQQMLDLGFPETSQSLSSFKKPWLYYRWGFRDTFQKSAFHVIWCGNILKLPMGDIFEVAELFFPWSRAIFLKISQMQWNLDFFAILAKYVAGVAKK